VLAAGRDLEKIQVTSFVQTERSACPSPPRLGQWLVGKSRSASLEDDLLLLWCWVLASAVRMTVDVLDGIWW